MGVKKLLKYVLAALLGILFVVGLYSLSFTIIFTSYLYLVRPLELSSVIYSVLLITQFIAAIIGIYVGIKSYQTKNIFYKIFKPNKNNILISLLLSIVFIAITILIGFRAIINNTIIESLSVNDIILVVIYGIISFYLFSALLYYAYKNKKSKSFKNAKLLIIILLIIFNPVFVVISDSLNVIYGFALSHEPCGVSFQAFLPDAPAMSAGMVPGETIISIDGIEMRNIKDMSDYMDVNQYEKTITVKTYEGNEYQLTLRYYETSSRYMMGIAGLSSMSCPR